VFRFRIGSCKFKRTGNDKWEYGIAINDGEYIIGADGYKVQADDVLGWRPTSGLAIDFDALETYLPILTALLARLTEKEAKECTAR